MTLALICTQWWSLFRRLNKGEKKSTHNSLCSALPAAIMNPNWMYSGSYSSLQEWKLFTAHGCLTLCLQGTSIFFLLQPVVDTYQRRVQPHAECMNNTPVPCQCGHIILHVAKELLLYLRTILTPFIIPNITLPTVKSQLCTVNTPGAVSCQLMHHTGRVPCSRASGLGMSGTSNGLFPDSHWISCCTTAFQPPTFLLLLLQAIIPPNIVGKELDTDCRNIDTYENGESDQ